MTKKETSKQKQSKLKHFMLAPVRVLKKARQIYMKSIVECAGGYGHGVGASANPAVHPQISDGDQTKLVVVGYNRKMKMNDSASAEVTKMERIDEDQACSFEEDQNQMDFKTRLWSLRLRTRRSNAV